MQPEPEDKTLINLLSDGSRTSLITDTERLNFLEKSLNGTKKFTKLHEIILSDHLGFKFRNNDFMFEVVDKIITNLHESGISDLIVRNEISFRYVKATIGDVALDMKHLDIWFFITLIAFAAALFVFLGEIYVYHNNSSHKEEKKLIRQKSEREKKDIKKQPKKKIAFA